MTPHLDGDVISSSSPGRGRRPADLATVTLADNVAATIEDLGDADDVVLVAHSIGGITAAHVLNEAPGRVQDVVLRVVHDPAARQQPSSTTSIPASATR